MINKDLLKRLSSSIVLFTVTLLLGFLFYIGASKYHIGKDEIRYLREIAYDTHPKSDACTSYNKAFYQSFFPSSLKKIDTLLRNGDSASQKKINSIIKNTPPFSFDAGSINCTLYRLDTTYIKDTATNCLPHLKDSTVKNLWRELFLEGFSYTASIVRDSFIECGPSRMPNVGLYIKGERTEWHHLYDNRKDTLAIQIDEKLKSLKNMQNLKAMIPHDWLNSDSIDNSNYLHSVWEKDTTRPLSDIIKASNLYKLQENYANHTVVFFHGYEVRLHSYKEHHKKSGKMRYCQQIFIAPPEQLKKRT